MRVLAQRWTMVGGGVAFAVYVARKDAPKHAADGATSITLLSRFKGEFLRWEDATVSAEHLAMEKGWDRYEDWMRHEKRAKETALKIIQRAFPETCVLDEFPLVWTHAVPDPPERHTDVWLDV